MTTQPTPCPYCRQTVIVDIGWAIRNGRVFCETCLKSFPIVVGEEEPEKEEKAEALKELEKELDKAVDEFVVPDTDDFSWI